MINFNLRQREIFKLAPRKEVDIFFSRRAHTIPRLALLQINKHTDTCFLYYMWVYLNALYFRA